MLVNPIFLVDPLMFFQSTESLQSDNLGTVFWEIQFTETKKYCLQKQKTMVKGVTFEWANNNNNQGAGLHFI